MNTDLRQVKVGSLQLPQGTESKVSTDLSLQHATDTNTAVRLQWGGGEGRAGKTTLSKMIKDKYNNYNLIHSDALKWAMIRAKNEEQYYRKNVDKQKEFEHGEYFQRTLLELYNSLIKKDTKEYDLRSFHSVSLTGGEPQLHAEFLKEFLPLIKEETKIYLETNATLPKNLETIKDYIDIISADIKLAI